jgi:hypothetical protein
MESLDPVQPILDNSGALGAGTSQHNAFIDPSQIGSSSPPQLGQESLPMVGPDLVPVDAAEVLPIFPLLKNGGEFSFQGLSDSIFPQGVDPLTGNLLEIALDFPPISAFPIESQTVLAEAKTQVTTALSQLIDSPALLTDLHEAFGESWNPSDAEALVKDLASGNAWPSLVVLDGTVLKANGAFSQDTNTIYLSRDFLNRNIGNLGAITPVLLEEIGHYIDSKLNTTDSPGDEGQFFAALVQGTLLDIAKLTAIKAEDDSRLITINDRQYLVEESSSSSPLTMGNTIDGAIGIAGDQNYYTFTLSEPSKLYIDVLSYESTTNWSIADSNGSLIEGGSLGFSGYVFQPLLNLEAGSYVLTINLESDLTGAYSIRVLDLADAIPIASNTTIDDTISVSGQVNLYQFQALADNRFNLNIQPLSGDINTQWRFIGPSGGEFYPFSSRLPETGTYTLLVEGYLYGGDSGSYSMSLETITDPPPEPLSLDSVVNGTIEVAGRLDRYTFSLLESSTLYFDAIGGDYPDNTYWQIVDANGYGVLDVNNYVVSNCIYLASR